MSLRSRHTVAPLVALALALVPAAAAAQEPDPEAVLQAQEAAVLGADHAAEHATARKARRRRPHASAHVARLRARGGRRLARAAALPSEDGRWQSSFGVPGVAIHTVLLPTNKVLYFENTAKSENSSQAFLLDLATRTTRRVDPPPISGAGRPANIWCAGQSFLPDGRVLVTGGNLAYNSSSTQWKGLKTVFTFDPFSETWARHGDMRHGRWYPGQVELKDGRTVIMSGYDEYGGTNVDVELFNPATNTTSVIGTRGGSGQPPKGGNYPHLVALPSGRVLVAGPWVGDSWLLKPLGSSPWWQDAPNLSHNRNWATGTLLPGSTTGSTKVMIAGGSGSSVLRSSAVTYDEATNAWSSAPSLRVARGHHNTVLLPDGSMVTVGGGAGNRDGSLYAADPVQRQIEIYDPVTKAWRLGPAQAEYRTYHSTAMLLPDATVLSGGDDGNGGTNNDTIEIYEPAYLHKGVARPTLSSTPARVGYAATFSVGSPDADVTRAVLVAPSAVTHSDDMTQRHVPLALSRSADGSGYSIVSPPRAEIAPPGHYMLFLVNDRGVPSKASWVRVG